MTGGSPQSWAMYFHRRAVPAAAGLSLAVLLFGCSKPVQTAGGPPAAAPGLPTNALPKLTTLKLWVGREELDAEVAATPIQVQTGMMFRTNINEMEGMLFILPYTQQAGFWMKNCVVELSVAYLTPEGVIREIHDLHAGNTNAVLSATSDILFALEVSQGWFHRHQVSTGMVIRTPRGSLAESLFSRH